MGQHSGERDSRKMQNHSPFSQSNSPDQSVMQLVVDQLEEVVVTLIEEIRQRPGVAAAILAGLLGAIVGSMLAAGVGRRRQSPRARAARSALGLAEAADLAGRGLKLIQNPLVRRYIR